DKIHFMSPGGEGMNSIIETKIPNQYMAFKHIGELSYMQFDLVFSDEVTFSIESFHCAPIFFAYCSQGHLKHSFGANGSLTSLKKDQSGIMSNNTTINNVLYFERNKPVKFLLIGVPTATVQVEDNVDMIAKMTKMFMNPSGNYIDVKSQNAQIAEKIADFGRITQKGIVKNLLKKSILQSIVEIEVMQHSYNYVTMIAPILDLATRQLDEIKRISNINVSEVLHNIGHAGRNYLPRFFKEKYHILNSTQNTLAKTA
ncbi:hypothetical protein, partial [Flavobacterium sp. HTF]|uniref:hypothetical protein n=1 Tax=Flavobacterium sp. HTF TaxID=2170732 RepID=UPI001FAF6394